MIRVVVVDDEELVRAGLRLILRSYADIEVVATSDGGRALETIRRETPDVVLLDIRMPEVNGLTILAECRTLPAPPAVAMLTTFDAEEHVSAALRAGAAGFLLKDTEPDQLAQAVRVLASGGKLLSPTVAQSVIAGYLRTTAARSDDASAQLAALSDRERDVLALLGHGLSNAAIGRRLYLGTATVKDHVSALLTKLGVSNRVQAAVLAQRAGLHPEPPT